jgi:hypothetical protein
MFHSYIRNGIQNIKLYYYFLSLYLLKPLLWLRKLGQILKTHLIYFALLGHREENRREQEMNNSVL